MSFKLKTLTKSPHFINFLSYDLKEKVLDLRKGLFEALTWAGNPLEQTKALEKYQIDISKEEIHSFEKEDLDEEIKKIYQLIKGSKILPPSPEALSQRALAQKQREEREVFAKKQREDYERSVKEHPYLHRPEILLEEAENYFKAFACPAPHVAKVDPNLKPNEFWTQILSGCDMISFGEHHSHSASKHYFCEIIPLLVQLGVDTIYLEGLSEVCDQDSLDQFIAAPHSFLNDNLQMKLGDIARTFQGSYFAHEEMYTYRDVLLAAKKADVKRLIALESDASLRIDAKENSRNRRISSHYQFKRRIDSTAGKGKSIIYTGAAHSSGLMAGIPNLGQIYGIPTFYVMESAANKIEFGALSEKGDNKPDYQVSRLPGLKP